MLNLQEIKNLLCFYEEMGMADRVSGQATPWLRSQTPILVQPPLTASSTSSITAALSPHLTAPAMAAPMTAPSAHTALARARQLADDASTLEALRSAITDFDGCALKKNAKNMVFSDGCPTSAVMLIGEAPGAEEDVQGIPFCGASGQLLDRMLAAIGLERSKNIYISNTIFWRPPGNRTPLPDELDLCRPFVEKHIALIRPKLLIFAGATAMKSQLGLTGSISRAIGKTHPYSNPYLDTAIPARVIYHPSFLLRQPLQKRDAWTDLLDLRQQFGQTDGWA